MLSCRLNVDRTNQWWSDERIDDKISWIDDLINWIACSIIESLNKTKRALW